MKKLIVVVFLLGININLFALSLEIEHDILKTELTQQLKAKQYLESLLIIKEIRSLGVEVSKPLDYFEGQALFELDRQGESYKKFESYVDANGKEAEYYTQAVKYLIKARKAFKSKDRIIRDSDTGLLWQDNHAAKTVQKNWYNAKKYCTHLTLAGHSDWRLPNYSELLSIVDYAKYEPAIKGGFRNVASDYYWSSSVYVSDSSKAWFVVFNDGYAGNDGKSSKYYVRCVRGR